MSPSITRRAALTSLIPGTAAIAGCADGSVFRSSTTSLGCVTAVNWHPRPHTVHLRAELDGETIHRSTRLVPAATYREGESADVPSVNFPGPWPTSGLPVLHFRLDDRDTWRTKTPGEYSGPDCTKLIAAIETERGEAPGTQPPDEQDTYRIYCRFATNCATC